MSTPTSTRTHDPAVVEGVGASALGPYRVIIHDDPVHTYLEVALAVYRTVSGTSLADGREITRLVDTTGQGVAAIYPKKHDERALSRAIRACVQVD